LRLAADRVGTRERTAELLEVSLSTLKNYLAGKTAPPNDVLEKLARAALVRTEWLRSGSGVMVEPMTAICLPGNAGYYLQLARVLVTHLQDADPRAVWQGLDGHPLFADVVDAVVSLHAAARDELDARGIDIAVAATRLAIHARQQSPR
jgi:transcriptional regulator with XRE-family HTH domain